MSKSMRGIGIRLLALAALVMAVAFLVNHDGAAQAQTPSCSIALTVTSPEHGRITGQWSTTGCPTLRAQYEWKMTSDVAWKSSHVTTAEPGRVNKFAKKGLDPGHYEFRIAVEQSGTPRVSFVSTSGADQTYGIGDVIRVRLHFSKPTTVTGNPYLGIDMSALHGGAVKKAYYESGSGTEDLVFAHTVVSPNKSADGVAVVANSLALNGGSIHHAGINADLTHPGIPHGGAGSAHKVDWEVASDGNAVVTATTDLPNYSDTVQVDVGPIKGQAKNLVLVTAGYLSLVVGWNTPSDSPEGTNLTGYFVEWAKAGSTTFKRSGLLATNVGRHESQSHGQQQSAHIPAWLDEGSEYHVRVISQFTNASNETTEVPSKLATRRVVWMEPMLGKWIDDTPNVNLGIGRFFLMADANRSGPSSTCYVNGGAINCPPRTLVSLDFVSSGTYVVSAHIVQYAEVGVLGAVTLTKGGLQGCRIPEDGVLVSGSTNKLVVRWSDSGGCNANSTPVTKWRIKHGKPGTGGTMVWETVDVKADVRSHTFNNQTAGLHKVQVIPVSMVFHDGTKFIPPVETEGMWMEYESHVDAGFTKKPDPVTWFRYEARNQQIYVEWDRPRSSKYYLGIEGTGPSGELHSKAQSPIYRYDLRYRRSAVSCLAASPWKQESAYPQQMRLGHNQFRHWIGGLESGLAYDVEIRAVNAVGEGTWVRIASDLRAT